MQDPNSLTRDRTHALHGGSTEVLTTGSLGSPLLFTIMNTVMNFCTHVSVLNMSSILLNVYQQVELLGPMVNLFNILKNC